MRTARALIMSESGKKSKDTAGSRILIIAARKERAAPKGFRTYISTKGFQMSAKIRCRNRGGKGNISRCGKYINACSPKSNKSWNKSWREIAATRCGDTVQEVE